MTRISIKVSEEAARWARKKAAEENTSMSRMVGEMLESKMRAGDEYWRAYRQVRRLRNVGTGAAMRMTGGNRSTSGTDDRFMSSVFPGFHEGAPANGLPH